MCTQAVHRDPGVLHLPRNHSSAPWPSCSSEAGGYQRTKERGGLRARMELTKPSRLWGLHGGLEFHSQGSISQTTQLGHRSCPQGKRGSTKHCHSHKTCISPRTHIWQFVRLHTHARSLWLDTHVRAWHTCTHAHMYTNTLPHACAQCTGPGEFGKRWVTEAWVEPRVTGLDRGAEGPASSWGCPRWGERHRPRRRDGRGGRGGQGGERARAPSPAHPRQRAALRPLPPQPGASG